MFILGSASSALQYHVTQHVRTYEFGPPTTSNMNVSQITISPETAELPTDEEEVEPEDFGLGGNTSIPARPHN